MMKNNKGVTLMALIVTLVVMTLLTGVGFELSYTEIRKVKDNRLQSELAIVRQVITEQYFKAVTLNKTGKLLSEPQESVWVGERITSANPILLPIKDQIVTNEDVEEFYNKVNGQVNVYQEDCYYRLSLSDQIGLGIADSKDIFIVNYGTGEVYNESEKVSSNLELLYLPGSKKIQERMPEDKITFNDWR